MLIIQHAAWLECKAPVFIYLVKTTILRNNYKNHNLKDFLCTDLKIVTVSVYLWHEHNTNVNELE